MAAVPEPLVPQLPLTAAMLINVIARGGDVFAHVRSLVFDNHQTRPQQYALARRALAIFRTLRKCEGVPGNMSAHLLRHTWNDRFSRLADDAELREAVEKQLRNFLMGWKETSEQGASYARRATQEEADRWMLTMQNDLVPEA